MNDATQGFDETWDVVVIGSGAAGMAAALTASHAGLAVTVLEKTGQFGGSTAVSGGAVWIPGNPHLAEVGLQDDRDQVLAYLRAILGNRLRVDMIDVLLDQGPRMVAFLEAHTAVRFVPRAVSPDYRSDLPGAAQGGRTIDPAPFDGRELGEAFALLRPPLAEFMVFGGMMVGRKDIDTLLGATRSWRKFRDAAQLVGRFARDRVSWPRGTRLLMGNALAGRLLKSALDAGIALRPDSTALRLIQGPAGVTGVEIDSRGRQLRIGARRGVVLATGGFPASDAMRARYIPYPEHHRSMAPAGNSGDGLRLALEVGATIDTDNVGNAFWTPVSVMRRPDGGEIRFPHLILDRQKPGLVAVDQSGRRFVNEATSYHEFVEAMHAAQQTAPTIPAILICDSGFLRRYGLGLVHPGRTRLQPFLDAGYLVQGSTIGALATRLAIDPATLEATVARMNDYARTGRDPEFGKGDKAYDRYLGDPDHRPNPCLGPIDRPPFYAVRVWPGDIGTAAGLRVDIRARVLDGDGAPIPGLYACGNDMNSIMAGTYPGAGITLGPALTFGYVAGCELAGSSPAATNP